MRGLARSAFAVLALCSACVEGFSACGGRALAPQLARPPARATHVAPTMSSSPATVPSADYKLAVAFIGLGALVLKLPWLVGGFTTLLGILFLVQTARVRFVFDEEAFEVKAKEIDSLFADDSQLISSGENFAVGGENRWKYESFVNWDFFPSEDLPILVYFKETQTPKDKWDVGPGKWANSEAALAKGAVPGQVHFFPCIANAKELKEQFEKRGCKKVA